MRSKVVVLGALSVLFLTACTPKVEEVEEAAETAVVGAGEAVEVAGDAMLVGESDGVDDTEGMMEAESSMTIDSFNFAYSEMALEKSPGESKTFTLTNSSTFPHDFVIDELGVATAQIGEGESDTFTITIPEDAAPGTTYAYYCSVGQHRAQGMEGVLTVK